MKDKLIVVDDDPIILELIQATLEKQNFEVVSTTSSNKALELFIEDPTLVVVSDLHMPEMSGAELMQKIFNLGYKPIFMVLTAETDAKKVVELFKQGVHDYFIKPVNSAELSNRIKKAFEYAELQIINENIKKERDIRMEHQLNWNLFKESLIKKENDKVDSGLMANINTNLVQGAGLGVLASIGGMIKKNYRLENDHYIVKKSLMDMLLDNLNVSSKLVDIIGDIDRVIKQDLPKEKIYLSEIPPIFQSVIKENEKYQAIKNHQVKLSENTFENSVQKVAINVEYFKKIIQELLLNAFKFSEPNSKVYVLFEVLKEHFQFSVLSTPKKSEKQPDGIPAEYHQLLFEPFFRLSRFVYESYQTLDYGLGLCYVDKIVQNHNGKINILNLRNFLESNQSPLISFGVQIPISD